MGLLNGIIGMVFFPNTGSVVVRSSQGRFFLFCLRVLSQKRSYFVIYEPHLLKNVDI